MRFAIVWGALHWWMPQKWTFQIYFPYVRITHDEIMVSLDTAARFSWNKSCFGVGFVVLGLGIGFSNDPNRTVPKHLQK